MKYRKLKIAIYSGSIPSTTFIENLIHAISEKHKIFLFGKIQKKYNYTSNVYIYANSKNTFLSLLMSLYRSFILFVTFPKGIIILLKQLKKHKTSYHKLNWWIRLTPVVLYRPDIFHIQWAKDVEHWMFLKEELGCKIVLSLRGAHINYSPLVDLNLAAIYRKQFPKIDAFHAVSNAIALEAQKYGAKPEKIKVIHSLISKNTLSRFILPEERNAKELKIVSVGRHHWKKGYSLALDACKRLKDKDISFRYTIIAHGEPAEELIFQRHQLGLLDEVRFESGMDQNDLFDKMQLSDVLLLPSLEEGIANVVLEAMAIGLPVISTDCGGMSEVVISEKTGWLVPLLDAQAMAKSIGDFQKTSHIDKNRIVQNAHDFVKSRFNPEKGGDLFIRLYESLSFKKEEI